MKKGIAILVAACLAGSMFALASCGSSASTETQDSSQQETQSKVSLVIGDETNADTSMIFTNETGSAITSASLERTNAAEDTSAFELEFPSGKKWNNDEQALVAFDSKLVTGSSDAASDVVLNDLYDMTFAVSGGETYTLHGLTFDEADEVSIKIDAESGLAYMVYSQEGGSEASTLEAEKAIEEARLEAQAAAAAAAEAAAQEAAAQEAAAQEAAAAAAAQEAAANSASAASGSTSGSVQYSYSDTSSGTGNTATQTEDSCIGGDLVLK